MPKINQCSNPKELPKPTKTEKTKVFLGLDLGTNCGYCIGLKRPKKKIEILPQYMGQLDLSAGPYDSGAIRFLRLRHFLEEVKPDLIAYEDVKFTPSEAITKFSAARVIARAATSSELIGAFRATLVTWAEENNVPCTGFPIGSIKRKATAKGNAPKEAMIAACNELFSTDFDPESYSSTGVDNIADAAFITLLADDQYGLGFGETIDGDRKS